MTYFTPLISTPKSSTSLQLPPPQSFLNNSVRTRSQQYYLTNFPPCIAAKYDYNTLVRFTHEYENGALFNSGPAF
ncbi:hypothetical protein WAI453_003647 [Rhynchosporium graminicola]